MPGKIWLPGNPFREEDPDSHVFRCSTCSREHRQREPYPPLCTGPQWTDDHEPTLMHWIGKNRNPLAGGESVPG